MSDDRSGSDERDDVQPATAPDDADAPRPEAPDASAPTVDATRVEAGDADPGAPLDDVDASREPPARDGDADVDLATDVVATDREAAANEAAERERARERRRPGLWALRATAGAATIAVGVLGVLAAPTLPSVEADPRTATVAPDAPEETRVCAGPLIGIGDASGDAAAIEVLADDRLEASASEREPLAVAGVDAAPEVLRGTDLAGAEWLTVASDVARGAAASECGQPATSQWLVGGSTTTGRSSVLTIANPGTTPTSVDLAVHGPDGRVDAVGSTGIAVGAGSVVLVDLAALAPGLVSPVVQVATTGGPVVAHLQHRVVRTLDPGGVEIVDPSHAGTDVAIPAVTIGEATGLQTQEGFADAAPALRLLAQESTRVTITTIAAGEEPIDSTLDLVGGSVAEVDLSGLAPGTYAFRIASDVPVVAAARAIRVDGDAVDLDWVQGQTEALDGATAVAVAPGESPTLHLLSLADEPTTVRVGETEVGLVPGGIRSVPLAAGTTTIEGSQVVAAVSYAGGSGIAGYAITPPIAVRSSIDVVL
ncbi:DUF5719 family protein [Agrococcus sp. SGAir0287]|uniref:DUF5719 family protein n=1 Tax=Agrococcus sp. SGAir0287 TaxID=2070347 RepID=UPI0010CCD350|nr:DUF5719 family protein [Agrococcus sp. SGAir0287]QCR18683.1 hypothetical protein C1N71_03800 [Agrococcus sp. SGAir0287]